MPQTMRFYQDDSLEAEQRQFDRGVTATVISLFTGLGKTNLFIEDLYRRWQRQDFQRAFVIGPAHLTEQTYGRMVSTYPQVFGGYATIGGHKRVKMVGVELADLTQPEARIIVGSVPTLIDRLPEDITPLSLADFDSNIYSGVVKRASSDRRVLVSERVDDILKWGVPDFLIYDETHHAIGDGSLVLIKRLREIRSALKLPPLRIVGYTATAWREDGRGLDNVFQTIAIHRGYDFGVKHGFLAPLATPIRIHADMGSTVEEALKVKDWMEIIVKGWREKARQADGSMRPTVAFFKTVAHSEAMAEYMRSQGIRAAHLDGTKTIDCQGNVLGIDEGRAKIFREVFEGKCQIICNFGVIFEGIDLPPLSCILWGRPTTNAGLTTQAIGRVLRLFEGNAALCRKEDALIIDVTGKELNVLSAGTLAGFKIDPLTEQYVEDEADEEVLLEGLDDGKDLRDVGVKNNAATSKGIRYSFARLIQKSGSDWFHDDRNDVLSLSISQSETLIVTPPHYTYKSFLEEVAAKMQTRMIHEPDNDLLVNDFANISELADILGGYCLWSVISDVPITGYLSRDPNLDVILDYATLYMNSQDDTTAAFYKRNRTWRNGPQTEGQAKLLRTLTRGEDTAYYNCGQASQRISHILYYDQRLAKYLGKRLQSIQKFLPKAKSA